jgi:hypothetical protein
MVSEQINWATRLVASFKPSDGSSEVIQPITNMELQDDIPADVIHSIDACNLGYSFGNPSYLFNFEVQAVNMKVFRHIKRVARQRTRFSVGLATQSSLSDDWFLDSIEMSDCIITNVTQSIDNSGGVPSLKFTAICLNVAESNDGSVMTTNHVGTANGSLT